ncbi:MAG: RsmE family RNA methyltransferase [Candidatus Paceibacterota bacterium]|jgi:16S rRNA (uracil1498-N3)-methyltransferase
MRLHRFYLAESGAKNISKIDNELFHQWKRVFRYGIGDQVILFNGDGMERVYKFSVLEKDNTDLELVSEDKNGVLFSRNVSVYFSIIKKDNSEWVVEKGTEIGVSSFTPIVSERSEKKDINIDRLKKITKEASEQSGRPNIPEITEVVSLEEALSKVKGQVIVFHQTGNAISDINLKKEVSLFIGPEGGWSDKEIELFHKKGIEFVSLGTQTLRAETAVVVATAIILSK